MLIASSFNIFLSLFHIITANSLQCTSLVVECLVSNSIDSIHVVAPHEILQLHSLKENVKKKSSFVKMFVSFSCFGCPDSSPLCVFVSVTFLDFDWQIYCHYCNPAIFFVSLCFLGSKISNYAKTVFVHLS